MSLPMYTRAREPSLSVMTGKSVEEVIQHSVLTFGGGLLRNAITNL